MDSARSYFFMNETLGIWTLFSSKLDSLVKKCVSNVLITGESNFDEQSVQMPRVSLVKK